MINIHSNSPMWASRLITPAEIILVFILGVTFFLWFGLALDHTANQTANGLWKSVEMHKWMVNSPDKKLEPANVLYFPVLGKLGRISHLEMWNVTTSKKMQAFNALFAGLALAFYFWLMKEITGKLTAALLGTTLQAGCAFFLLLATISEDIMPAYACFVASVTLLVHYAKSNSLISLFASAQMFTLSWLFHWTMLLPGAAALFTAIFLMPGTYKVRYERILVFASFSVLLPALCSEWYRLSMRNIFWPGKGLGTGWGGWLAVKWHYAWAGIGQYLFGGRNIVGYDELSSPFNLLTSGMAWIVLLAAGIVFARHVVMRWRNAAWRVFAVLSAVSFLAAETINLYTQPQDPQLQLQPLFWVPAAMALLAQQALVRFPMTKVKAGIAVLACLPLAINCAILWRERGGDSFALTQLHTIERHAAPDNTLYITHGFDYMTAWSFAQWGPKRWHVMLVSDALVYDPSVSGHEAAAHLLASIHEKAASGLKVVVGPVWDMSEMDLVKSLRTVGQPEKIKIIHQAIKKQYAVRPLVETGWGRFYRVVASEQP